MLHSFYAVPSKIPSEGVFRNREEKFALACELQRPSTCTCISLILSNYMSKVDGEYKITCHEHLTGLLE